MASNYDNDKQKYEQLKRKWSKANKFSVELYSGFATVPLDGYALNACITSVQLPDISNEVLQDWIDGRWKYANGRISVPQLTITFRDSTTSIGSADTLYKFFSAYINIQKNEYFDNVKFAIKVNLLNPRDGSVINTYLDTEGLLNGVSGVSFNQQSDQIVEFSCTWSLKDTYLS